MTSSSSLSSPLPSHLSSSGGRRMQSLAGVSGGSTSGSSGNSSTSGVVSYEGFAPRSTAQVSRLSRIAALTAGPTARAAAIANSSNNKNKNDSNSSSSSSSSKLLFSNSMSVPCLQEDTLDPSNNDSLFSQSATQDDNKENNKSKKDNNSADTTNVVQQAVSTSIQLSTALQHQWKHTTSLRLAVRASINIAEDISQAHAALIRHSGELSAAADRLQEQAEALETHAAEIGQPLQHYDAVDRIGIQVGVLFKAASSSSSQQQQQSVRGLAKIKVDSDDFPEMLQEIDHAILYFGKESGGPQALADLQKRLNTSKQQALMQPLSGNLEYYRRAMILQEAALFLIQEAVAERIQTTTTQIQNATSGSGSSAKPIQADQLEASLLYTRFHGISSRSNRLLMLVKQRLQKLTTQTQYSTGTTAGAASGGGVMITNTDDATAAYYDLLQTCRTTYCTCREQLLRPIVRAHMDSLDHLHGSTGMTRLASLFLSRLCTLETSLFADFFGDAAGSPHKNADFQAYLASLCTALHRTVRRSLVSCTDLDTLCQIVSVLREEGVQASKQADSVAAARAMMHLTEDAQERVIFCANRQLQKDVIRFKATPKDLDYPNKLLQLKQKQQQPQGSSDDAAAAKEGEAAAPPPALDAQEQLNLVYESWFPPMRTVLRILSKIFRVVETQVFEDMALQSVQACTKALKDGAHFLRTAKSIRDADLFLVKHLLILREQLSPFDMELRTVERQLDFSDAGKAMAKFLANRNRRLLSMSTENAVLTLLREGVSVQESSVDSKRDLEEALRAACNDFIEHAVTSLAGNLVAFVSERSGSTKLLNKKSDSPQVVTAILQSVLDQVTTPATVATALPGLVDQMSLYLDNPATQNILLKPVTKKIVKAVEELQKWIQNTVDHQWNAASRTQALEICQEIEPAMKKAARGGGSA